MTPDQPSKKCEYRTLRERWEADLKMPFQLLRWSQVDFFLCSHQEALLWFLADWDGPSQRVRAIFKSFDPETFTGLPFGALDLDEINPADFPVAQRLNIFTYNCYLRFSNGKEKWRQSGPKPPEVYLQWFQELRSPTI